MHCENTLLRERSQTQKTTSCVIPVSKKRAETGKARDRKRVSVVGSGWVGTGRVRERKGVSVVGSGVGGNRQSEKAGKCSGDLGVGGGGAHRSGVSLEVKRPGIDGDG